MFLATIPAVLWVDKVGRKPVLVSGAFIMAGWVDSLSFCDRLGPDSDARLPISCHIIVAILTGIFHHQWDQYVKFIGFMDARADHYKQAYR